jgi:cytoskeletal protein RodZ
VVSTQSEQSTARPGGPRRSLVGLLWSLLPVLVVVVLLVLWQRGSPSPVQSVDPTPDVTYAKRVSPVPLPAPGPLPGTWRATSSHVDAPAGEKRSPVTLTIGYLTEDDRFAEVVIGDRPVGSLLADTVPQATADGNVEVGPTRWQAYRSQRGEQVIASTVGEAGVVVTGDASGADLAALALAVR